MKIVAAVAGAGALAAVGVGQQTAAWAGTSATGNTSAAIVGGSLSVGSVGTMTALAPSIGGTATGALPSAQWADDTGLGLGWNGTVAISPLTYTGTWTASSGSVALSSS
ncbi:MAG TPA: hypothetical protein VE990_11700, partial [Acidimicrobiales bacterium]|nr:hypothetical protein [Acidimicrobiales bacterium]